jgi:hypothetical protein
MLIDHGDDDPPDLGVYESLMTGRGPAMVVARFQRDDRCRTACAVGSCGQGLGFGVRFTFALVESFPDGLPLGIEQNAAHGRVRTGAAKPGRRYGYRTPHRGDFCSGRHALTASMRSPSVAVRGRGAELRGGLGAAEEEQAGGFRPWLPGTDQEVSDAAQTGEVPHADRLGPFGLADREQDTPAMGVVAKGRDVDLV